MNLSLSCRARLQLLFSAENLLFAAVTGLLVTSLYFTSPDVSKTVDYVLFYKPNFRFLHDSLASGTIPWWNPYVGLGRPFIADAQNAVFYPPAYLLLPGTKTFLFLFVWVHSLLAVFGMRRLCRSLGFHSTAGYFAAFAFILIAPMSARLFTGQLLYAAAICYLPICFAFAVELDRRRGVRPLFIYALLLALQFLCGHPQVFWLSVLGQGIFVAVRSAGWSSREAFSAWISELLRFGLVAVWAIALTAISLLPFLELIQHGNRASPTPALAAFGSMGWTDFVTLIAVTSREEINWEKNLYIGLPILIIGAAGLTQLRDRNVRAIGAVLFSAFLISVGDHLPTFSLFYNLLPGFAKFRIHARAGMLICFALVMGASAFVSSPPGWLASFWKKGFGYPLRYLFIAFASLTAVTLSVMLVNTKRSYGPDTSGGGGTGYPFQQTLLAKLRDTGLASGPVPPRVLVPSFLIPPNAGMELRFRSPDAYTSLFLKRPWNYLHYALNLTPSEQLNSFLPLDILQHGPFPYTNLDLAVGYDLQTQSLLINTNPFPTAFVVYGIRYSPKSSDPWDDLKKMDLRRTALLDDQAHGLQARESTLPGKPATVTIYKENSLTCDVEAEQDALLVLNEAYYPGWKCALGERLIEAIPVNGWMRGFPIPPGKHAIRVFFHPNYFLPAAAISLTALLIGLLLSLLFGPKRQTEHHHSADSTF